MTLQSAFKSVTGLEIEEGIKQAIVGEWKGKGARFNYFDPTFGRVGWYLKDGYAENDRIEAVLLDPSFWRCLGVGEKWGERLLKKSECCSGGIEYSKAFNWCKECGEECRVKNGDWKVKMHLFVDRLAEEDK